MILRYYRFLLSFYFLPSYDNFLAKKAALEPTPPRRNNKYYLKLNYLFFNMKKKEVILTIDILSKVNAIHKFPVASIYIPPAPRDKAKSPFAIRALIGR